MARELDTFDAYRRIFASTDAAQAVCWWYCGVVLSDLEGLGNVPTAQAETLMVFRIEDVSADQVRIHWKEVGYFRDMETGEGVDTWLNPLTGERTVCAKGLDDGPAFYTVTRSSTGIDITLDQAHAEIHRLHLETVVNGTRIGFVQTEDKRRTYQRADGSWPDVASSEASEIRTVLSVFGNLADAADSAVSMAPATGFYWSGAPEKSGGAWSGKVVKGVMRKAAADEQVNPIAWARLNAMYPAFFKNGRADPGWD